MQASIAPKVKTKLKQQTPSSLGPSVLTYRLGNSLSRDIMLSFFKIRHIADCAPFLCSETGKPFETCLVCQRNFFSERLRYLIEKAYHRRPDLRAEELVFEVAVCLECHDEIEASFSEDSKRYLEKFFSERANVEERAQHLLKQPDLMLEDCISRCVVHNTPKEELTEYQLVAYCVGQNLHFAGTMMLGGPAVDELIEGLSEHTLGEARRFRDTYLDTPPELKELLDRWCFV